MKKLSILIIIVFLVGCQKNDNLSVHIIDVGQGDSILIKTLTKNILIDGGDEKSDKIVSNYLKKNKVKNIDILIASHLDSDHIGGLDNIIDKFNVSNVYAPNQKLDTLSYANFINSCNNKNIKIYFLKKDDFLEIEDNINLQILSPSFISDDNNKNSIVCKLNFKNKSFLFTGDIEKENEIDIINSFDLDDIDFLKVAHHGSSSSSHENFILNTSTYIAVISCGYKNKYNHPHKSTLDTLNKHNVLTYRTDLMGDIVFYSDGDKIYTKKDYQKAVE